MKFRYLLGFVICCLVHYLGARISIDGIKEKVSDVVGSAQKEVGELEHVAVDKVTGTPQDIEQMLEKKLKMGVAIGEGFLKKELLRAEALAKKGGKVAQEVYRRTLADLEVDGQVLLKKLAGYKSERAPWARIPDQFKFNEATIVGSHDSYQSTKYGYTFGQTLHTKSITEQLEMGVRYLDLRVWDYKGELKLCHHSCTLATQRYMLPTGQFTPFISVLKEVKAFLDKNKDEVVIITLGQGVEAIDAKKMDVAIVVSGLDSYALKKTEWDIIGKKEWPTYGWLRKQNKRVIFAAESDPYETKYVYPDLFAKPKWVERTTNKDVPRLLVLSMGVETPSDVTPERLANILSGKESYHLFGIYSLDYLFRSFGFLQGKAAAPMAKVNTVLPYQYAKYIYDNGFGDQHLWKGQWPTVIASDFVGQGDLFGAAECINKELRGWGKKGIDYPKGVKLDCAKFK